MAGVSEAPSNDAGDGAHPEDPASNSKSPRENSSKQASANDDYIPPLHRKLGPYQDAVNAPVSMTEHTDPVYFQLRKLVGLTVASSKHEPKFSGEFLQEMTNLTAEFMHYLFQTLHKMTESQRHSLPGIADLDMCFSMQGISPAALHEEYLRTKALSSETKAYTSQIYTELNELLREYNADKYNLDKEDPSIVFHANEHHEIATLVPRRVRRRDYIPNFLPELPPDFTYTSTGNYMKITTDLKEIRLNLAEESRLNEASLYRLIDDDEMRWQESLEQELIALDSSEKESDVDDIMSHTGDRLGDGSVSPEVVHGTEKPSLLNGTENSTAGMENSFQKTNEEAHKLPISDKKFDFVDYAQKRRRAKEKRLKSVERRRKLRRENVFMQAEKFYSPYATAVPTKAKSEYFESILETGFKKVIKATRLAEQRKAAEKEQLLKEQRERDEQQGSAGGAIEFGFAFNPSANISEDSDEEDMENGKDFDFGDNEQTNDVLSHDSASAVPRNETLSKSPGNGQISGKAPLKTPRSEVLEEYDAHSENGSELENFFGSESAENNKIHDLNDTPMESAADEARSAEQEHTSDTDQPKSRTNGDATSPMQQSESYNGPGNATLPRREGAEVLSVSWANADDEESDADELEDLE